VKRQQYQEGTKKEMTEVKTNFGINNLKYKKVTTTSKLVFKVIDIKGKTYTTEYDLLDYSRNQGVQIFHARGGLNHLTSSVKSTIKNNYSYKQTFTDR